MKYCERCRKELKDDAIFCSKCGAEAVPANELAGRAANIPAAEPVGGQVKEQTVPVQKEEPASAMTLEESIALAEEAKQDYLVLEKMEEEIADNERKSKNTYISHQAFSRGRFYWPYPVAAVVIFVFFDFLFLVAEGAGAISSSGFLALIALGVPLFLIIFGFFRAGVLKDRANAAIYKNNKNEEKKRKELLEKNVMLKSEKTQYEHQLKDKYPDILSKYRNSNSMSRAAILLKSGKAQDLDSALKMIK